MTLEMENTQLNSDSDGGDLERRDSQPPVQFFHSHMYESEDGAELHGWGDEPALEVIALAEQLIGKRNELQVGDTPLLVPETNEALRRFLKDGLRKIRAQHVEGSSTTIGGERLVVASDGKSGEYVQEDGTSIRRFDINSDAE